MTYLGLRPFLALAFICGGAVACGSSPVTSDAALVDASVRDTVVTDVPIDTPATNDALDTAPETAVDATDVATDTGPDVPTVVPRAELQIRATSTSATTAPIHPVEMLALQNGDYLIVASGCLFRVDANYGFRWTTCFNESGPSGMVVSTALVQALELADGSIFAIGNESGGGGATAGMMLRFGGDGTLQWARRVSDSGYDTFRGMLRTGTTDLLLVGGLATMGAAQHQPWVVQVGIDGSTTWSRSYALAPGSPNFENASFDGGMAGPGSDFTLVAASDPGAISPGSWVMRIASTGPLRTTWATTGDIVARSALPRVTSVVGDGTELLFGVSSQSASMLVSFNPATGTANWSLPFNEGLGPVTLTPTGLGVPTAVVAALSFYPQISRFGRDGTFQTGRAVNASTADGPTAISAALLEADGTMRAIEPTTTGPLWMLRSPMNSTPDGCRLANATSPAAAMGTPTPFIVSTAPNDAMETVHNTDVTSQFTTSSLTWTASDECPP